MITVNSLSELEFNSVCLPSIPQELGLISSTSKKKKVSVGKYCFNNYTISLFNFLVSKNE